MNCRLLPLIFVLVAAAPPLLTTAAPVLRPGPAPAPVGRYQKFELTAQATGTVYTNPYSFDVGTGGAVLRAVFTAPSGAVKTVDGFWQDGYTLASSTTGALSAVPAQNGWRVRFAPTEAGVWAYSLTLQDGSGISAPVAGTFSVNGSANAGFVRRQAGKNYLRFDSGAPYLPIGENLAWGNSKRLGDYKVWLDQLAANRATCIRVWLCYWGMELEWKNVGYGGYSGLKRFSQTSAYELDWLLDYCTARGIYVELCLNNHGQLCAGGDTPQWASNPYNAANGGPCPTTQPWSFFSNVSAKATYKNKLRYLVARYAYSPNLLAWEFFNELDLVDGYNSATIRAATATWISEMAAYLKSIDPNRHLVSNSYAMSNGNPTVWNNANIDFLQTHIYQKRADLETPLAEASAALRTAHDKPYLTGEFGLEIYHNAQTSTMLDDPNAVHFRTTMWASAFNGSLGPGLSWWWDDYVHTRPTKTYPIMKAIRGFTDVNLNVATGNYQPSSPELTTPTGLTMTIVPGFAGFQPPTYAATPAPASTFVVNTTGTLTPSAASLGTLLFGAYHATARRPPTFQVNCPVAGQVQIVTGERGTSSAATLVIKVNGTVVLTQTNPVRNAIYSIGLPPGPCTVALDNTGNEWLEVQSVSFTNYQARLVGQALRDGNRVVGYVRNRDFTWQYYLAHNQTAPPAVAGGTFTVRGLVAGATYAFRAYSTLTGGATGVVQTLTAAAAGVAIIRLPTVNGDLAFTFAPTGAARPLAVADAHDRPTATPLAVELWPNPASPADGATVGLPDATPGPVRYELSDALGRRCRTAVDAAAAPAVRQHRLSLNGLAEGAYVLRVSTPNSQRAIRIVVRP
ncbi:MAG: DUF5060 domain-containing protein [Hymenobacteraceae bacterium]|nr:DUF5060 domain-containing protein [Hymenobacteraceae bacterium]